MVRHLANKNIQDVLTSFQAVEISGKIRKPSVLASEAWAKFASEQFKLHEHIIDDIRTFNEGRRKTSYLPQPRPAALFALALDDAVALPGQLQVRYEQLLTPGFSWVEYVADPANEEKDVLQAKYEICALALAGFLIVHGC